MNMEANQHVTPAMRSRLDVLTPAHVADAARALIFRLRHLHENFATRGGDSDKAMRQHERMTESLANFIAILAADDAYREIASELRAGLEAAISSAKSQGFRKK
jgi:hypothetical protein